MTQPMPAPAPAESFDLGGQFAAMGNIFIDPAAAARQIPKRLSWLLPFLVLSIVSSALSFVIMPITIRVMRQYPPEGMAPEQVQTATGFMEKMQYASLVTSPLFIAIVTIILAGILMGICSVMDVRTKLSHMFSLLCYAGLIPLLQGIAGIVVIKAKEADIQSVAELRPRFGLDLVFHEGPKALTALIGYFSIFNLWYIVMLALTFAALTKVSKGKAFAATAPVWIVSMLFTVLGAMFQRG